MFQKFSKTYQLAEVYNGLELIQGRLKTLLCIFGLKFINYDN